jgi:glutamate synthase domain-containing protein 3
MNCVLPSRTTVGDDGRKETTIDASGRDQWGRPIDQRALNIAVRQAMSDGAERIMLEGVMGQRYIASAATRKDLYIGIKGTPGNDLGAFMDGPTLEVFGNAQDMTGNTMSSGRIVVHGNAWDVTGLAARGGRILVKGSSGYRVGIHMKAFGQSCPSVVIGGRTGDYLGEYMAGGHILVLGNSVPADESPVGTFIGAGMHGGAIFVRGKVEEHQLGTGAKLCPVDEEDKKMIEEMLSDFERSFGLSVERDWERFSKITPMSSRPFRGRFDPTMVWP